jgi:hypothetical protein
VGESRGRVSKSAHTFDAAAFPFDAAGAALGTSASTFDAAGAALGASASTAGAAFAVAALSLLCAAWEQEARFKDGRIEGRVGARRVKGT